MQVSNRAILLSIAFTVAGLPAYGQANASSMQDPPVPGKYSFDPHHAAVGPSDEFKVVRVFRQPAGFAGVSTYDQPTNRLFLISFGPPANTKTDSMLYEVDPDSGGVLAQTRMPFQGEIGSPAYLDGFLYVGVPWESKLYRVLVSRGQDFGKVVKSVPIPKMADLKLNEDEPYRFPFLTFSGVTATPDQKILVHAEDIGEFITLDPDTGHIVKRVKTLRALGGLAAVPGPRGEFLIVGNADPQMSALRAEMRYFMFRSKHGVTPPSQVRPEVACGRSEVRDIRWVLVDADSGEVLASTVQSCTRANAGGVSLLGYERVAGTRYGRFKLLTNGEDGMFATVQWTPGSESFF